MAMNHQSKKNEDADIIAEYLAKGGNVTKGETKPMPNELQISNKTWNNPLSKDEKKARGE